MTTLRAIRDDLVEKRLWPLAVVLLLVMVAAPIVLARGDDPAPPAPAPLPAPVATAPGEAQPVVLEQKPRQVTPRGRFHDPFRPTGKGPAPAAGAAPAGGAAGTATAVTPAAAPSAPRPAAAPAASTVAPAAPVTSSPPAPVAPHTTTHPAGYRVDFSWGDPARPRSTRDAPRLSVLRADGRPALVFLGVRRDGDTAVFMLASQAVPSGDGRCRPTQTLCHVIELRAGDSEFFDVTTDAGIVQYELHVDHVAARAAPDAATAKRLLARVAPSGRSVLAGVIRDGRIFARRFVYASARGVLVFSTRASARHVEPAAVSGSALPSTPPAPLGAPAGQ